MADVTDGLNAARDAFARRDWAAALEAFRAARTLGDLSADDWFALADSAWWQGLIDESLEAWEEAYRLHVQGVQPRRAAMAAMYLAAHSSERGDVAAGSGWMSRMKRLLRDAAEGAEHGYPIYFEIFAAMGSGDLGSALASARRMQEIGRRFDDPNLVALGVVGEGRAMIKQGRVAEGLGLLDESMLAALSDELHPLWTGAIYCHLMDACRELGEVRRASEWTHAASQWCAKLPDAALYRGICRVHRAQVLQIQGAWDQAEQEATRACTDVIHLHPGTVAEGHTRSVRSAASEVTSSARRRPTSGRMSSGAIPSPGWPWCGWCRAAWAQPPPRSGQQRLA